MKKLVLLFCALSLAISTQLSAQTKQDRNVDQFDAIQVSGGIDLYLKQGSNPSVMVKAPDKIIDDIQTYVENGKLIIKMKKGNYRNWGNNRKEVYVVVDDINFISSSGGSDVVSEELSLKELYIQTSGGSDVSLDIEVEDLKLSLSGGSDIKLEGQASRMEVKASGAADLSARQLKVKDCEISTSGASDASIYVTGELSMTASGGSDISYTGNPRVISSKSSGGADISGN